jgi:hypothetical protein
MFKMHENTGRIQENGRFKKADSAIHTMMAEMIFESGIEVVCKLVLSQAKEGHLFVAKIILDRLLPPKKDRPSNFKLPSIQNADDALKAGRLVPREK